MARQMIVAIAMGAAFFVAADHFLAPPDCASYWAWGDSLLRHFSFEFADSYERLEMPTLYVYLTRTGRLSNDWPMGSGLALAPAMPLGVAITHAWTVLMIVASLTLWWRGARAWSGGARAVGVAATVVGTPLMFYGLFGPFFSHPVSFAVSTAFLVVWGRTRGERNLHAWVVLGVLLGFAGLVRPQNLFLGVVLIPEAIAWIRERGQVRVAHLAIAAVLMLIAFAPQLVAYWRLYGSVFAIPKLDEMHWLRPAVAQTLFSDFHGVVPWTPVYVPAVIGLLLLFRRDAVLAGGLLLAFVVQVYLNAANAVWWSGGSFGNRRLADSAIVVAYGIATLWAYSATRSWRITIATLVAACCAWSVWLVLAERTGGVPLDRYVPFNKMQFSYGMINVFAVPADTIRALARPMLTADSIGLRIAASIIVALGTLGLMRLAVRVSGGRALYASAVAAAACAVVLVGVTAIAAARTQPLEAGTIITRLAERPKVLWDNYIEVSFYELERRHPDKAEAWARKAIALRPDHYSSWWYLAVALMAQERWTDADAAFTKVLEYYPEHPRARQQQEIARQNAAAQKGR